MERKESNKTNNQTINVNPVCTILVNPKCELCQNLVNVTIFIYARALL